MPNEVFLDTSYAIALSSTNDDFHNEALVLAAQLEGSGAKLITTRAVLLEIGNALSKLRYRQAAFVLLRSLETDPNIEIVPLSKELYSRALLLFSERTDKEWGLTDCVAIVVMQDRSIRAALTTDDHFRQAGFQVLLQKE